MQSGFLTATMAPEIIYQSVNFKLLLQLLGTALHTSSTHIGVRVFIQLIFFIVQYIRLLPVLSLVLIPSTVFG